jgi:flagellar basal body-associated protein FliL
MTKEKKLIIIIIVVIAVGIITIGQAISYFRDQEIKTILESENMTKALSQSDRAMESFKKTKAETDKVLCGALIREYLKDPNSFTRDLLKSESCKGILY